jgi:hypothetical protein
MTLPLPPDTVPDPADPDDEDLINDPGNEDPGSIEKDALVPLIEDDDAP